MHFAFPLPWLAMLMLSGFLLAPQTPPGEEPGPGDGIGLLFPLMSAGLTLVAYVLAALVSAVTKRLSGGPPASVVALQLDRIA